MKLSSEVTKYSLPRDIFLHLAIGITLYAALANLMILLFNIVDRTHYYHNPYETIAFAIAGLVICSGLYVFFEWLAVSVFPRPTTKTKHFDARHWFVHLALFVSGAVMVCSLIFIFGTFLLGAPGAAFSVTMSLLFFVVSGLVFKYYFWRTYMEEISRWMWVTFISVAAVIVCGAILLQFYFVDSPFTQRDVQVDVTSTIEPTIIEGDAFPVDNEGDYREVSIEEDLYFVE